MKFLAPLTLKYAVLQYMHRIRSLHERRRQEANKQDLLWMLLAAREEEKREGMNVVQLRDEVMTMLLEGQETTANTLNWT